jgi:HrpA-like RNA helicase
MSDSDDEDPTDAFFNGSLNLPKIQAAKPTLDVKIKVEENLEVDWRRSVKDDMKYATKYQEREREQFATQLLNMPRNDQSSSNIDLTSSDYEEIDQSLGIKDEKETETIDPCLEVYKHYSFNQTPSALPILQQRENIMRAIESNPVVVLSASTGIGKSSQVLHCL